MAKAKKPVTEKPPQKRTRTVKAKLPPPPPVVETPQVEVRDPKEEASIPPATTQEATETVPAPNNASSTTLPQEFPKNVTTVWQGFVTKVFEPYKLAFIIGGLLLLLVIAYFVFLHPTNSRIVRQGEKKEEQQYKQIVAKQDSLLRVLMFREQADSVTKMAFAIKNSIHDEINQGVRNKVITDARANELRSSANKQFNEVTEKIKSLDIARLDSMLLVFKSAREANKDVAPR